MFVRVVLPLLAVGLAVYALVDLAGSDEEERGGIPKWLWVVLIILLPLLGPVAWILVKRSQRRGPGARLGGRGAPGAPGARRRSSGPVAPDDDPDFLWRLAQQQRRQGGTPGPAARPGPQPDDAAPGTAPETASDADGDAEDGAAPDGGASPDDGSGPDQTNR